MSEHADQRGDGGDQGGDRLVEGLAQRVHVVGDPGEDLALADGFKVLQGHPVDLFGDVPAEAVGDLRGDAGADKALNVAEQGADQVEADQDDQNVGDAGEVHAALALDLQEDALENLRGGLT